jgi:hypothetical protein
MTWIVQYFQHMANKWRHWRDVMKELPCSEGYDKIWRAGSIAYAERQARTWAGHAATAAREFTGTNPKYRMSPGDDVN